MKTLMTTLAALAFTAFAFNASAAETQPVIHDQVSYFVHLDVAKVLSTSNDTSKECGVQPAHLDYLDHQGREHELDYQEWSNACGEMN